MARPHGVCVVCGGPTTTKRVKACNRDLCRASLLLHPQRERGVVTPDKRGMRKPKKPRAQDMEIKRRNKPLRISLSEIKATIKAMGEDFLQGNSDWSMHGYVLSEDRRGINMTHRDTIWGFMSRKKVFLKAIARKSSEASLVIRCERSETVHEAVRRQLMGGKDRTTDKMVDVFFAWKCGCPEMKEVIYNKVIDLPNKPGYHDPCGNCGAAPLEVFAWDPHQ